MAGATIGQTFTHLQGTFTEVAADPAREDRGAARRRDLQPGRRSSWAQATGISPLQDTTVLDQTFNDVDLVGRPLTIGNFVSTSSFGAFFLMTTTNTYTPYIELGDEAFPDPSRDTIILGKQYQEVVTNFPLASQILTGLFLNITLSGPEGSGESYQRALVDRIGYAARQSMAQQVSISVKPNQLPIIGQTDLWTVNLLPGVQPTSAIEPITAMAVRYGQELSRVDSAVPSQVETAVRSLRNFLLLEDENNLLQFLAGSGQEAANYGASAPWRLITTDRGSTFTPNSLTRPRTDSNSPSTSPVRR